MNNKAILLGSILLVSSSVFAGQSLLGNVAEQAAKEVVKDTVKQVVPGEAVKAVEVVNRSKATVNKLKIKAANAPKAVEREVKQKAVESAVDLLR